MERSPLLLLALLLILSGAPDKRLSAAPPPLSTALTVETAAGRVSIESKGGSTTVAPVRAHLRAGATPVIRWTVRNLDSKRPAQRVAVHFVVARAAAGANPPVPNSPDNTIESALGTDLAPLGSTTGEYHTPIEDPGLYLVTVEIRTPDGEIVDAATVDLSVE